MDHNRTSEIAAAVVDLLRAAGRAEWFDEVLDPPGADPTAGEVDVDWTRLGTLVDEAAVSESLREKITTLRERFERPYPSLLRVRFDPAATFDFAPGQYVTVRYQDVPRPYSIVSLPSADFVEICVRRVPGGRLTSELATDLSVGEEVVLQGPYGEFVLESPSTRDPVFLATGTGVAPIKSMIEYVFREGRDVVDGERRDVWLFLGSSWEDDLPYRERFRQLEADRGNFHFVPTLSRESYLTDWEGETAYVQNTFLKYLATEAVAAANLPERMRAYLGRGPTEDVDARIDPRNVAVYSVGIGAMVHRLMDVVRAVGVPPAHAHAESYG